MAQQVKSVKVDISLTSATWAVQTSTQRLYVLQYDNIYENGQSVTLNTYPFVTGTNYGVIMSRTYQRGVSFGPFVLGISTYTTTTQINTDFQFGGQPQTLTSNMQAQVNSLFNGDNVGPVQLVAQFIAGSNSAINFSFLIQTTIFEWENVPVPVPVPIPNIEEEYDDDGVRYEMYIKQQEALQELVTSVEEKRDLTRFPSKKAQELYNSIQDHPEFGPNRAPLTSEEAREAIEAAQDWQYRSDQGSIVWTSITNPDGTVTNVREPNLTNTQKQDALVQAQLRKSAEAVALFGDKVYKVSPNFQQKMGHHEGAVILKPGSETIYDTQWKHIKKLRAEYSKKGLYLGIEEAGKQEKIDYINQRNGEYYDRMQKKAKQRKRGDDYSDLGGFHKNQTSTHQQKAQGLYDPTPTEPVIQLKNGEKYERRDKQDVEEDLMQYEQAVEKIDQVRDKWGLESKQPVEEDMKQYEEVAEMIDEVRDQLGLESNQPIEEDMKQYEEVIEMIDEVKDKWGLENKQSIDERQYKEALEIIDKVKDNFELPPLKNEQWKVVEIPEPEPELIDYEKQNLEKKAQLVEKIKERLQLEELHPTFMDQIEKGLYTEEHFNSFIKGDYVDLSEIAKEQNALNAEVRGILPEDEATELLQLHLDQYALWEHHIQKRTHGQIKTMEDFMHRHHHDEADQDLADMLKSVYSNKKTMDYGFIGNMLAMILPSTIAEIAYQWALSPEIRQASDIPGRLITNFMVDLMGNAPLVHSLGFQAPAIFQQLYLPQIGQRYLNINMFDHGQMGALHLQRGVLESILRHLPGVGGLINNYEQNILARVQEAVQQAPLGFIDSRNHFGPNAVLEFGGADNIVEAMQQLAHSPKQYLVLAALAYGLSHIIYQQYHRGINTDTNFFTPHTWKSLGNTQESKQLKLLASKKIESLDKGTQNQNVKFRKDQLEALKQALSTTTLSPTEMNRAPTFDITGTMSTMMSNPIMWGPVTDVAAQVAETYGPAVSPLLKRILEMGQSSALVATTLQSLEDANNMVSGTWDYLSGVANQVIDLLKTQPDNQQPRHLQDKSGVGKIYAPPSGYYRNKLAAGQLFRSDQTNRRRLKMTQKEMQWHEMQSIKERQRHQQKMDQKKLLGKRTYQLR